MRLAQARHIYTVSSQTFGKIKEMICSRCNNGFEIGQIEVSKTRKAHSKYGVYHKKCAEEVLII